MDADDDDDHDGDDVQDDEAQTAMHEPSHSPITRDHCPPTHHFPTPTHTIR